MQLSLFPEENLSKNDKGEYHTCPLCKEEKHESEFYREKRILTEDRLKVSEGCKPCYIEKVTLIQELHKTAPPIPDTCACCGKDFKEHNLIPQLDHCHTTKRFNAWLCAKCNGGLGKFDDDIEQLKKAINYLEKLNERD